MSAAPKTEDLVSQAESVSLELVPKSYDELLAEAEAWKNSGLAVSDGKFRWGMEIWKEVKKTPYMIAIVFIANLVLACIPPVTFGTMAIQMALFFAFWVGLPVCSERHSYAKRKKENRLRLELERRKVNQHKLIVEHVEHLLQREEALFLGPESTLWSIRATLTSRLAKAEKRREQLGLIFKEDEREGVATQEFVVAARERNEATLGRLDEALRQTQTIIAKFEAHFATMRDNIGNEAKRTNRYELIADIAAEDEESKDLVAMANEAEYETVKQFIARMMVFRETASRALQGVRVRELAAATDTGDINDDLNLLERTIDELVVAPATE